jgi:leucyl-tRNA synthetase
MERYNFKTVEKKWQNFWDNNKTFVAHVDKNKKKFYCQKCFLTPQVKYIWVM